jgi:hypothetical protein
MGLVADQLKPAPLSELPKNLEEALPLLPSEFIVLLIQLVLDDFDQIVQNIQEWQSSGTIPLKLKPYLAMSEDFFWFRLVPGGLAALFLLIIIGLMIFHFRLPPTIPNPTAVSTATITSTPTPTPTETRQYMGVDYSFQYVGDYIYLYMSDDYSVKITFEGFYQDGGDAKISITGYHLQNETTPVPQPKKLSHDEVQPQLLFGYGETQVVMTYSLLNPNGMPTLTIDSGMGYFQR